MIKPDEHRIKLKGLKGNHPLGALAAFGLLRCCAEITQIKNPKLHWEQDANWTAVLTTSEPLTPDELITLLLERQAGHADSQEFKWSDDIKVEADLFRQHSQRAALTASPTDRRTADFFAAYGCELVSKDNKVVPTAFHMTSGQQRFIKELRQLASSLFPNTVKSKKTAKSKEPTPSESLREALFETWQYRDKQHSLGWDPSTERTHALRAESPTEEKSLGVRAAVWLAVESLPLFPCAINSRHLQTRGFTADSHSEFFTWALWNTPLSFDSLKSLTALRAINLSIPSKKELKARGIVAIFRTRREMRNKGLAIFKPAQLCSLK